MTVTPLSLRPLVSRRIRTIPADFGSGLFVLQVQSPIGLRQVEHIRPC